MVLQINVTTQLISLQALANGGVVQIDEELYVKLGQRLEDEREDASLESYRITPASPNGKESYWVVSTRKLQGLPALFGESRLFVGTKEGFLCFVECL